MLASFVIPTHDRPAELAETLARIGALQGSGMSCEVIVVDNASKTPVQVPRRLVNSWPVQLIRLSENTGAAARNIAAKAASGEWLLMLDDDSSPDDLAWITSAQQADSCVAAIGAAIRLSDGQYESGGLPEVFVGCGALVRRTVFLEAGGYDASFGYYGEETDFCARCIAMGYRIEYAPSFRVTHSRAQQGRDLGTIIERLTRNEAVTIERYAPDIHKAEWIERTLHRRMLVARRENKLEAYERGLVAFRQDVKGAHRQPLSGPQWDRLTGSAFTTERINVLALEAVNVKMPQGPPGKHQHVIEEALQRAGIRCDSAESPQTIIAGTLAPGRALAASAQLQATFPRCRVVALSPLESLNG